MLIDVVMMLDAGEWAQIGGTEKRVTNICGRKRKKLKLHFRSSEKFSESQMESKNISTILL